VQLVGDARKRGAEIVARTDFEVAAARLGGRLRQLGIGHVVEQAAHASDGAHGESTVVAPMPGTVIRVLAAEGDRVEQRQPLLVIEAMKMETPLVSPFDATVLRVHVAEGDRVTGGALLVELEA